MSFRPACSPRRLRCAAPAAYYVARNNGSRTLTIRITRQLAHSAGIKGGDAARFDIGTDSDAGTLRLTPVQEAARHWTTKGTSNQSLYIGASWSGDLEQAFPNSPQVHPLEVANISRTDGLTLKLPDPTTETHETQP